MRIIWNNFEPPVPLDIGDDPQPVDFVVELLRADGSPLTIKRTQFSRAGEVWLFINGKSAGTSQELDPLIVDRYAIRVYSYELDEIPSHQIAIVGKELKGKSLRIRVDAA